MTPEQESMSDLTKRLREMAGGNEAHYCYKAADRIEQLERERDAAPATECFTISREAIARLCPICRDALLPAAAPAPERVLMAKMRSGVWIEHDDAVTPRDPQIEYRWFTPGEKA